MPFRLQVDASGKGAGVVQFQEDEYHSEHPVSYFSKKVLQDPSEI